MIRSFLLPVLAITTATAAEPQTPRPWEQYRVILWTGDTAWRRPDKLPLFWQRVREMGVDTGMVHGDADPKPLLDAGMPYYVENLVNKGLCLKWNSTVRDWDAFVTKWKDTRDEAGAVREYCLDDPEWRQWARSRMAALVKKHAPHHPLLHDIRDEISVTISANPFDFDFHPLALAGFRAWLQQQYPSLDSLNRQWQTAFTRWEEVKPFTTDRIKNRMAGGGAIPRGKPDWQALQRVTFDPAKARRDPVAWNFSPWADHRSYMDVSLARVLEELRATARAIDPRTPVGIEGTQMPSAFGGYDLWRLSRALDWVEPYDICDAREILGSFMPGKPFLCTVGEQDARAAQRRLWHLLLLGDKGCIVWWSEDSIDWNHPGYPLTPRAKSLAPVLKDLRSPMARLFLRARRETDPIAIHYSQPSIQVAWLVESTVDGSTWLRRFSSHEASHNRHARVRHAWLETLQDLGYSPVFVSTEPIEGGDLRKFRALVLPQSWSLTDAEAAAIRRWQAADKSATLLCDSTPGLFDGHAKLRPASPFEPNAPWSSTGVVHRWTAVGKTETRPQDMTQLAAARLATEPPAGWYRWLAAQIPVKPPVIVPPAARVQTHRFRLGPARLIAFERNLSYTMGEDLKQAGGNQALEKPVRFEAKLTAPAHVHDLRGGRYLGRTAAITVDLDPWQPALFALTDDKLPAGDVIAALHAAADASRVTGTGSTSNGTVPD